MAAFDGHGPAPVEVRAATRDDSPWILAAARELLGGDFQAMSHRQFHVLALELVVAARSGDLVGFLGWEIDGPVCEVLAIGCTVQRAGIGSALMEAARATAREQGCRRIRVVTTDANLGAQRFYERLGYRLAERRVGAVDDCRRRYKPAIPPDMHDELSYERSV